MYRYHVNVNVTEDSTMDKRQFTPDFNETPCVGKSQIQKGN